MMSAAHYILKELRTLKSVISAEMDNGIQVDGSKAVHLEVSGEGGDFCPTCLVWNWTVEEFEDAIEYLRSIFNVDKVIFHYHSRNPAREISIPENEKLAKREFNSIFSGCGYVPMMEHVEWVHEDA